MPRGDEHFHEHVRSREVSPPTILYKYTTVETARIVLSTGKLRFRSPLSYNDPFDSQWDMTWPASTPEAIEYERALIRRALLDPGSWPDDADPKHRRAMARERERIRLLPGEEQEDAITDLVTQTGSSGKPPEQQARMLDDLRRRMRVLCLSERDDSILMWSHYADQHCGVAIGFESSAIENGLLRPLEPVLYRDAPPSLIDPQQWHRSMIFGLDWTWDWEAIGRQWALTKHSDWSYEREWRFALIAARTTLGDHEDIAFPRASLVELVFGCRTDQVGAAELQSLARAFGPQVSCWQMSARQDRFQVERAEMTLSRNS
ncbi:MAG: DUF2971 domain-containing protein [Planctomycetes bacterium]|nr:DUF2971 domain-containing protein [Planctomycetota bacterium]